MYWVEHPLRPRDFPRPSRCPSGHLSGLGKSLGRRGCTNQYIPPLGSVRIQYVPSASVEGRKNCTNSTLCIVIVSSFHFCLISNAISSVELGHKGSTQIGLPSPEYGRGCNVWELSVQISSYASSSTYTSSPSVDHSEEF